MKKWYFVAICFILAMLCCCLSGCSLPQEEQLETSKETLTTEGYMTYVEYDGHEYLIWSNGIYKGGICHSPKCPCKTK